VLTDKTQLDKLFHVLTTPILQTDRHDDRIYRTCMLSRGKNGCCSSSRLVWKVNGQYKWDILLSQQTLAIIRHFVDDNFVFQQHSTPAHDARYTDQLLQRKTLNFISLMTQTTQSW